MVPKFTLRADFCPEIEIEVSGTDESIRSGLREIENLYGKKLPLVKDLPGWELYRDGNLYSCG